jgi:hypothetical protein
MIGCFQHHVYVHLHLCFALTLKSFLRRPPVPIKIYAQVAERRLAASNVAVGTLSCGCNTTFGPDNWQQEAFVIGE